jgi:hypothetical protein
MRWTAKYFFAPLSLVLLASTLFAQTAVEECRTVVIEQAMDAAKPNLKNNDRQGAIKVIKDRVFDPNNDRGCQALMLASVSPALTKRQQYALAFNQIRTTTQNQTQSGANASNSGTTNLVSKNLTPFLLSAASEYGGMTQSTSGQTTTLSGTLSGIPLAVESHTGAPLFAECTASFGSCTKPKTLDRLSRFSYSVALSTAGTAAGSGTAGAGQGNAQPVTLSGTGSTSNYNVTQVTGKVAILRQYPTSDALQKAVGNIDKTVSQNISDQAQKLSKVLEPIDRPTQNQANSQAIKKELDDAAEAILQVYPSDPAQAWDQAASHLSKAAQLAGQDYVSAIAAYLQAIAEYTSEEDLVFEATENKAPTLSFEYDLNRPSNQPTNSNFKLVLGWTSHKPAAKPNQKPAAAGQKAAGTDQQGTDTTGPWTLTLNATASIYNNQPSASIPSAGRLRDVQVAAEADYKLSKSVPILGKPTFTGAFYYQDQTSPSILKAPISGLPITGLSPSTNQVFTQRGPIDIGQFKVSFGTTSSGISVPLSITIANRTELLTGMDVRGQIGISYSFDSLLPK